MLGAALPPATLADVAATAASTLFEAAPLLLIAAAASGVLPRRVRAWLGGLLGCGCGAGLPGGLSLPATVLCWISFGPVVAAVRWLGAFGSAVHRSSRRGPKPPDAHAHPPGILDELGTIAGWAFFGAALTTAVRCALVGGSLTALPVPLLFLIGLAVGALTTCTLGSVAFAAGIHATLPAVAYGVLCTAGMLTLTHKTPANQPGRCRGAYDVRFVYATIALACAIVAARGGATLVHPKLVPWIALGALLASTRVFRDAQVQTARSTQIAAVAMLATALTANAPLADESRATALDHLVVGERLRLSAQIAGASRTTLVRYAITCCRADAAPIAVRLNHPLALRTGSWVSVDGTVTSDAAGPLLRVTQARAIAPPADPFIYR